MSTAQGLILIGVGLYFSVGAYIAFGINALSMGFAGRFEPMSIAIFFGWPIFFLMHAGRFLLALPFIGAVVAMVGLAYWLMHTFQ